MLQLLTVALFLACADVAAAQEHWITYGNVTAPGFKDFRGQYLIGISVFADGWHSKNCADDSTDVTGYYNIDCIPEPDGPKRQRKRVCVYHRLYDKWCRGKCTGYVTKVKNINFELSQDDPIKEPYCYDEKYPA
uniref:Secreted protein n=1 Tax=Bursaphelenchus xylophilus TaxID=6326 RepID=A0A1I7SEM1_BURXY